MPTRVAADKTDRRGITWRWCSSCREWKRRDSEIFQRTGAGYWFRRCRVCVAYIRSGGNGHVELSKLRRHIDWMIGVVGWNEARRRIGVPQSTLTYWLQNKPTSHGKFVRRITKQSARKILTAAFVLRSEVKSGTVVPLERHTSRGHCQGCGADMETYTEGCTICWERRRGRARRAA